MARDSLILGNDALRPVKTMICGFCNGQIITKKVKRQRIRTEGQETGEAELLGVEPGNNEGAGSP
jgi:hypothetical protein